MVPTVGNHDTPSLFLPDPDTSVFLRYFPFAAEPWASIDVGPAHLLLLSTETREDFGDEGVQYEFADADLEAADPDLWTLPTFHVPPYNAGDRHADEQSTTRALTELFDGRVDAVVSGHEHLYQRTLPLQYDGVLAPSGTYGRGSDEGVLYLVVPPAGTDPEHALVRTEERARLAWPDVPGTTAPSEVGFVVFDLGPDEMRMETWEGGDLRNEVPFRVVDQATVAR